jgi:hypothetical protein
LSSGTGDVAALTGLDNHRRLAVVWTLAVEQRGPGRLKRDWKLGIDPKQLSHVDRAAEHDDIEVGRPTSGLSGAHLSVPGAD